MGGREVERQVERLVRGSECESETQRDQKGRAARGPGAGGRQGRGVGCIWERGWVRAQRWPRRRCEGRGSGRCEPAGRGRPASPEPPAS